MKKIGKIIRWSIEVSIIIAGIVLTYIQPDKLPNLLRTNSNAFIIMSQVVLVTLGFEILVSALGFDDVIANLNTVTQKSNEIIDIINTSQKANPLTSLPQYADDFDEIIKSILECEKIKANDIQASLIKEQIDTTIHSTRRSFRNLKDGNFDTDYWNCTILTDRIKKMKQKGELIGVTNWDHDKDWWQHTTDADKFFEANRFAIQKRHCVVKRVFIYSEKSKNDPKLAEELKKHTKIKVEVYTLCKKNPEAEDITASCVIDDAISYKVEKDPYLHKDINHFSVNPDEIEKNKKRLTRLLESANKYTSIQHGKKRSS